MNILQKKPRIKATLKYLIVLILVLLVTISQDYLSPRHKDYSFYASESFLFNHSGQKLKDEKLLVSEFLTIK